MADTAAPDAGAPTSAVPSQVDIFVAADTGSQEVKTVLYALKAELKERGVKPAWRKHDKEFADSADAKPTVYARAVAKSRGETLRLLRATKRNGIHAIVAVPDAEHSADALTEAAWALGVGARTSKHTVVVSQAYCEWLAGGQAAPPPWLASLPLSAATCTFVPTPSAAADVILRFATPKPPRATKATAAVAESGDDGGESGDAVDDAPAEAAAAAAEAEPQAAAEAEPTAEAPAAEAAPAPKKRKLSKRQ